MYCQIVLGILVSRSDAVSLYSEFTSALLQGVRARDLNMRFVRGFQLVKRQLNMAHKYKALAARCDNTAILC